MYCVRTNRQISPVEHPEDGVRRYHRIPLSDLLGKKRTRSLVRPRQMAMALAKGI